MRKPRPPAWGWVAGEPMRTGSPAPAFVLLFVEKVKYGEMTNMDTPDLDAFFGPKKSVETVELHKNTRGWRCEPRLWRALDAFCDHFWEPSGKTMRKSLIVSARALMEEVKEAEVAEFVEWAAGEVRKNNELYIKDLRSLLFLVPKWRSRKEVRQDEPQYRLQQGSNDPTVSEKWYGLSVRAESEISKSDYITWIRDLEPVEYIGGKLRLEAMNSYARDEAAKLFSIVLGLDVESVSEFGLTVRV